MAASSSQLRTWWAKYKCETKLLEHIEFFGRGIGGVAAPTVEAYAALEMALETTGYDPTSRWAYNCRPTSSGLPSLHGFGIAIDIDPKLNPFTTRPFSWDETDFTPAQIKAVEGIKTTQGNQQWAWGGRWNSIRDYMHFQIDRPPTDVEVDWSTVTGHTPAGPRPPAPWAADSWNKAIAKGLVKPSANPHARPKAQRIMSWLDKLGELD